MRALDACPEPRGEKATSEEAVSSTLNREETQDAQPLLWRWWPSSGLGWLSGQGASLASSNNESLFPLETLPALPQRGGLFWSQPASAIAVVGILSAFLVSTTCGVAQDPGLPWPAGRSLLGPLIWLWAALAALSTAFILLGRAGEVQRSTATCYPIPEQVVHCLEHNAEGLRSLDNINGPEGSRTLGTYCVRCLVWRPPNRDPVTGESAKSHHCSICQRCVVGFDHHCDFFGRCIVSGNMVCFGLTIGMLWAGLITSAVAFFLWAGAGEDSSPAHGTMLT